MEENTMRGWERAKQTEQTKTGLQDEPASEHYKIPENKAKQHEN